MVWRGETAGRGKARAAGLALAVHGLALLAALAASQAVPDGGAGQRQRLTVFTTPAPAVPPPERQPTRNGASPALASPAPPAAVLPRVPPQASGRPPAPAREDASPAAGAEAAPLPPPTLSVPPEPPVQNEDAFADYRQAVWRQVHAQRPRGGGQVATATVRFRLDPSGALLGAELAASCGDALLDRLALRAVRAAAPFPAAPAGVGAERLVFSVPIRFR